MTTALAGTLVGISYVVARVWAILRAQVLPRAACPGTWWAWSAALAIAVGVPIGVGARVETPSGWPGFTAWCGAVGLELALGTAIGMIAALPGYAIVGAAHESVARLRASSVRAFTALVGAVSVAAALSLGLHRPVLGAIADTFVRWPAGDGSRWSVFGPPELGPSSWEWAADLALLATDVSILALGFATPVLLAAAVVDLGSAWVARGTDRPPGAARTWMRFALSLTALGASWDAFDSSWFP